MAKNSPTQPLLIDCALCGSHIVTERRSAWVDAIDHALDEHRAQLLATPEYARRYFRITNPLTGKNARLASTSPQEPASS